MQLGGQVVNDLGSHVRYWGSCYDSTRMEEDPVSKYLSGIGRKGGYSRAKRLTPEQRKEIASKAGKGSGRVRSKKAKKRKPTA